MEILNFITPKFMAGVLLVLVPLLFWGFNFIVLYHLLRFGIGVQPKRMAAIYFVGSSILFCIVILLSANLDLFSFKNQLAEFFTDTSFFRIY